MAAALTVDSEDGKVSIGLEALWILCGYTMLDIVHFRDSTFEMINYW